MNPLFDPTFPHGTPEGYSAGCRSAHCPEPIPCRVVHVRYRGDYRFRTRLDQGMTLSEILSADAVDDATDRRAMKRAPARPKKSRPKEPQLTHRERAEAMRLIPYARLKHHIEVEKLTDRQIGDLYGYERRQITQARVRDGLPCNRDVKGNRGGMIDLRLPEVEGLSHEEAGRVLGRSPAYIRRRRQAVARKNREEQETAA